MSKVGSLVSHDGLRDSLTNLLALPAFLESATREISSAQRNSGKLNLSLISLTELSTKGEKSQVVEITKELSSRTEQELFDLAARVVHLAHALEQNLRNNDLLCRYTFADFLILSSGDLVTITEKLRAISELHGAVVVSAKLSGNLVTPNKNKESTKSGRESGLSTVLAKLEKELVALLK
jgi:GGDEF domain-containing protein